MTVDIKHRRAGAVLYTATIPDERASDAPSVLMGFAVREALKAGAYLEGANLTGAYLEGANLRGAYLTGATWAAGVTLETAPLCLTGLHWPVWILDTHMQIGCELHTFEEWEAFGDRAIAAMNGAASRRFWDAYREPLLALCATRKAKADCRQPSSNP